MAQPETDVSVYDEPLHRVEYEHPLFRVYVSALRRAPRRSFTAAT